MSDRKRFFYEAAIESLRLAAESKSAELKRLWLVQARYELLRARSDLHLLLASPA